MAYKNVAFVTCKTQPNLTEDDRIASSAIKSRQINVIPTIWSNPDVDWSYFDSIVIRSVWDYHIHFSAFLEWIEQVNKLSVCLWNPASVLSWNSNKTYLHNLQLKDVNTVPTEYISEGKVINIEDILNYYSWDKVVLKPTISASASSTFLISKKEQALANAQIILDRLLTTQSVMIQPFVPEICSKGEWSMVFFNKQFSHAVLKKPAPGDFRVQRHFGGYTIHTHPSQEIIDQAISVLSCVEEPLLYARVDGIEIDGTLIVMELELIEPCLFFNTSESASEMFADAICATLK